MLCRMRFGGDPCQQDARWEVRFGGRLNIPACDEHLADARRFFAQWGVATEEVDGLVHTFPETALELPVGPSDWELGKASGREWATDVAELGELWWLDGLYPYNPSTTRASRCRNIAYLLNPTDAGEWPTLRSWLDRDPAPSLNWLAGFVDGALGVLEERAERPAT